MNPTATSDEITPRPHIETWNAMTREAQRAWLAKHGGEPPAGAASFALGLPVTSAAGLEIRDADRHESQALMKARERLATLREDSVYGGVRVVTTLAAFVATIALLVALWPVSIIEHSTRPNWTEPETVFNGTLVMINAGGILLTWCAWALARAFLDRCDLAVRTALKDGA